MKMSRESSAAFDAAIGLIKRGADTAEVIFHCWQATGYKPSEYQVKHWRNKVGVRRVGAQDRQRSNYEPEERRAVDCYRRLMRMWPPIHPTNGIDSSR